MKALNAAQNAFLTVNAHLKTGTHDANSLAPRDIATGMEAIGHTLGFAECHLRHRVTDKTVFSGWLHAGTAQLFADPEDLPLRIVPECASARVPSPLELITATHIGTYTLPDIQKPDSVLPEFILSSARLLAAEEASVATPTPAPTKIKITDKETRAAVDTGLSDEELLKILNTRFEELDISVRSANCLKNAGIVFVGDYIQESDAEKLKIKNMGRKSLNELKDIIFKLSGGKLDLYKNRAGLTIEGWERPKV